MADCRRVEVAHAQGVAATAFDQAELAAADAEPANTNGRW